ncbi:MAG: hypothetical protein OXF74_07785 [Rhodobacteraceae bacterium]|nr:hypothetical protein [Paracoccaceae bacterium]
MPNPQARTATLESKRLRLQVTPEFGARVTGLTDLATGRQWLVEGGQHGGGEAVIYGKRQAVGWDECLPTVAPCRDPSGEAMLRDHGAFWGRRWDCRQTGSSLIGTCEQSGFRLSRGLHLNGPTLVAGYEVTNLADTTLPFMWSQHCLLAARPGERIEIQGVENFRFTDAGIGGRRIPGQSFIWPYLNDPEMDLSEVRSIDAEMAVKIYGEAGKRVTARVGKAGGFLTLSWSGDQIPGIGVWLDYGGWPEGDVTHQIAIEPTTAPVDDLSEACREGLADWLDPGERRSWVVVMSVGN